MAPSIRSLVEPVLGQNAFAVRGLFFDKTQEANWKVPWHQDLTIVVKERLEVQGFGPWSIKEGVPHVQPPVALDMRNTFLDRKSTRLNSSHQIISYAVFCLKKKTKTNSTQSLGEQLAIAAKPWPPLHFMDIHPPHFLRRL